MTPPGDPNDESDAPAEANDFIRKSDFESNEMTIAMKNTTTKTEVRKGKAVTLVEILERGLALDVPEKSCAKGHNLALKFELKWAGNGEVFKFEVTAKVDEIDKQDDGTGTIQVTFLQFDEKQWNTLLKKLRSRQEEVFKFFAAAKGY